MKLRGFTLGLLIGVLGLCLLAACNGRPQAPNANSLPKVNGRELPLGTDKIPRITVTEAKLFMEKGESFFVDTRDASAYRNGHIKGAINLPYGHPDSPISQLPKDKLLIAYCD